MSTNEPRPPHAPDVPEPRDVPDAVASAGERSQPCTLGVFAHPDDETLSGGPILATMASRGPVTLVTATRGEYGEVIGTDLAHLEGDHAGLAAHREGEVAGAVAALGVHAHHFLDQLPGLAQLRPHRITDSGMRWPAGHTGVRAEPAPDAPPEAFSQVDLEISARLLAGLIRTITPDLVLTEEPDGGYGHPDHVQAHRVTMRAVRLAADPQVTPLADDDPLTGAPPWRVPVVAWVVRPRSRVEPALAWLHGYPGRPRTSEHTGGSLRVLDPHQGLPTIVHPDEDVAIDLALEPGAMHAVGQAMSAHRSQIQAIQVDPALVDDSGGHAAGWFALSNDVLQPVPARATAMLAPGWGSPQDLHRLLAGPAGNGAEWGAVPAGAPEQKSEGDPVWYARLTLGMVGVLGIIVAMVGTAFHRWHPPFGVLLAILVVFAAAVLARSLADRRGHLLFAAIVVVVVVAMTYLPGNDVLVTGQPVGVAWLVGAPLAALAAGLVSAKVFRD